MRQAGLLVLFASDARPGREAVRAAIAQSTRVTISHEPANGGEGNGDWMELLSNGLGFDLLGLAPGPAIALPTWRHLVGLEAARDALDEAAAIGLFAGPHIEAAAHILPVVRTHLLIARDLVARLPGVLAVCWTPAALAIAPDAFLSAVDAWLAGQGFPALSLVGFRTQENGALESDGLAYFTGQELVIGAGVAADRVAAVQLAMRLVHELVAADPVAEDQDFTGPDMQRLRLSPRAGGSYLSVSRG